MSGASFTLQTVTKGTASYTGLDATVTRAALIGVDAVDLQVSGHVQLNQTSRTDGQRFEWSPSNGSLTISRMVSVFATGSASVNVGPGNLVAVIQGLTLTMGTQNVASGNPAIGTVTAAEVLSLSVSSANLFAGTGASLNAARDGITTTGAVGFLVSGASFTLQSVTKGTASYTGLDATVTRAALLGVAGVDLQVSGHVQLNQTSRTDGERFEWSTGNGSLTISRTVSLYATGSASLNIGPGNVVAVIGSLTLSMSRSDVDSGNATIGTLTAADRLNLTVTSASVFVGTGAALNAARDGITTTGAVGFLVSGASFTLQTVTKGTASYTGLDATVTSAALVGVGAVDLQVSGHVQLNQSSRTDGERFEWSASNGSLSISHTVNLFATGSASLNVGPGNVVAVIQGLTLTLGRSDVDSGNATIGTITAADRLALTVTSASVFVGTGAALTVARDDITTTGAVGFLVSDASFTLQTVGKGTTSYTGIDATVTRAALIGVSAVDLQVSGHVQLNQSNRTDGERFEWSASNGSLTLARTVSVFATGSASLNIGPGNLVAVIQSLALSMGRQDVVSGNAAIGTITAADVLSLTVTNASLFAGTGATLNAARDSITTTGAVGFLVSGAGFTLQTVSKGTTSYSGIDATVTRAALLGMAAVDLEVSGHVQLNQSNRTDGQRIEWSSGNGTLTISRLVSVAATGTASLNVGPGNVVAVIQTLTLSMGRQDVASGNVAIGTLTAADVMSLSVSGASLFAGTGASLNGTRDGITTTGAVGFLVSGASFTLQTVSKGADSYSAIEASVTSAALLGVDAVDLQVSGTVQQNQTSRTDGQRFAWSTANGALAIGSDVSLKVMNASASLNIGPGNVVAVIGSLTLTMGRSDVASGNAAIGTVTAADVMSLSVSGASLFAGTGASLNGTRDGITTTGAVGFLVSGASFTLQTVSKGTDSYSAIQASVTRAALLGVAAVDLQVSGTVQINQTSRTDGQRFAWSTANGTLAIGSDVSLKVMNASASLNIGPGNVVAVIGSLTLSMGRQDVASGNAAIGTVTAADVMSLSVSGASLFAGTGAALNGTRDGITTTGAVGFLVSGASFTLQTVSKGTDSYSAIQASVTKAALLGVAAVDLQVSGTVQLNQTSRTDGQRFAWSMANGTLAIGSDVSLKVMNASASLNIGPGNVVAVIGSLTLTMSRADVDRATPRSGRSSRRTL